MSVVNVPIGALVMLPAVRVLVCARPRDRVAERRLLAGALMATAGLMLGVYAIVGTSQYGWGSARTLGGAAAAVALLAAFVTRQATTRTPLLPLRVFSVRELAGANLAQLLVIAAAFGFQVMITLYMQRVLGYGAAASGLGLLPTAAVIGTVALGLSARIAAAFGPRAMLLAGLGLITAGLALLTLVPVQASYPTQILPPLLIFGAGGGLCLPALASLGMSGATPADAGLASGLFNTTQQIGAALGVAVLSTLAAAQTRGQYSAGAIPPPRWPPGTTWPSPSARGSAGPRSWWRPRCCGLADDEQLSRSVVEPLVAVGGADHDVLDPRAVRAGVDPRLHRERHARLEHLAVAGHDVRVLVRLQPDPVTGPVEERLAVPGRGDRLARGRVDRLRRHPRPDRGASGLLGVNSTL